jgi:zinc finger protein
MPVLFRWWPFDGGRHAIPDELDAGDSGQTLCGLPLTYTGRRLPELHWLWPTCKECWKTVLQPGYIPRGKP